MNSGTGWVLKVGLSLQLSAARRYIHRNLCVMGEAGIRRFKGPPCPPWTCAWALCGHAAGGGDGCDLASISKGETRQVAGFAPEILLGFVKRLQRHSFAAVSATARSGGPIRPGSSAQTCSGDGFQHTRTLEKLVQW